MNEPADSVPPPAPPGKSVTPLFMRIFWFGVAALVTVPLNPALFALFQKNCHWPDWLAYALSLGIVNVVQFIWSYNIGFKTNDHWTISAVRQGATLLGAAIVNYVLVLFFLKVFPESWFLHPFFGLGLKSWVIVGTQVLVAGLKFIAYHFWVYPDRPKAVANSI